MSSSVCRVASSSQLAVDSSDLSVSSLCFAKHCFQLLAVLRRLDLILGVLGFSPVFLFFLQFAASIAALLFLFALVRFCLSFMSVSPITLAPTKRVAVLGVVPAPQRSWPDVSSSILPLVFDNAVAIGCRRQIFSSGVPPSPRLCAVPRPPFAMMSCACPIDRVCACLCTAQWLECCEHVAVVRVF